MKREMNLSALMVVALAGSSLSALGNDWAAAVDGDWNVAVNWLGGDVPNTDVEDAALGLVGAYKVDIFSSFTIRGLSITNPDATLSIFGNQTLTLNDDLVNNGTFIVNETGSIFNGHLSFNADAVISGSGSILLNAPGATNDAQILANAFTVTHSSGHLIHGSGNLAGNMLNGGNIIADDATGAALQLSGTLTQNASGNAGADGSTMILANGSLTTGGEFVTMNGGVIHNPSGTATIGSITNSGDMTIAGNGNTIAMNGNVQNDGTITINSTNQVFNSHLRFDVAATLGGSGSVTMQSNGATDDAQIYTNGVFNGTIGTNQTVQGAGRINGANGGTIVNLGTINGNDAGALQLQLQGNHSGNGVYRSDNGLLGLGNTLVLDGGTFDSSGTGIIENLSGIATLSNVTNLGEMGVRGQGGSITLVGPMVNDGTLTLNTDGAIFNAHLRFGATTGVTGSGTVQMVSMGGLDDAQVFTDGVFAGTIGAGQTIQGSGQVDGRFDGTIVNNGTINGNHAAVGKNPAIQLQLRGNHDGSGGGVYRSDDGILGLSNTLVLDGGTFDSSGVGIVDMTTNGEAMLSNVTNLGEMGIRGQGGSITLVGPMTNDGNITVNSDGAIFNAHIRFGASTMMDGSGTVTMVSAGSSGDAQMFTDGAFVGTIGASQTVQGSGQIEGGLGGTIVNHGTINGNDPLFPLELRGVHTGTGVYRSDNGVLAYRTGTSLDGGTMDSSGTGILEMTSNGIATFSNMTNLGELGIRGQGGILELPTSLTNNGNITINTDGAVFNAHIRFIADAAIDGTGTINMATAGSIGDAQIIADTGFVGTIGSGQSLSGDGLLVGELNMDGSMDPDGILRRFDIDTMHMSATSGMTADLGGLLAGDFDRLLLGGSDSIDLDGTLTVNLDAGYVPQFTDSWTIIDGGTVTGYFETEIYPPAPIGLEYKAIYEANRVFVVLTCASDLNGDGLLNFLDVSTFLNFFSESNVRGDINGDGNFNFLDVSLFLQIFGGGCN